ncbi:hypothetical protein [Halobellus sp. Atlit-38R]|jgi:hypothetical protein|uniref:hypothetical protein n=1 Tax=Halobellus sp. Atlit-38R TaxID=2282131 RepID=UPI001F19F5E0|nr:hypothetical protein [Halobellus sp. Atlit-38R]
MTVVDALPPRPLEPQELLQLNDAEALELAVPIEDEGRASGVLVATGEWVKGLAFDADAESWTVVETVALDDGVERVDGLQACEAAILRFRGDDPEEMTAENAPGTYEPQVDQSADADGATGAEDE